MHAYAQVFENKKIYLKIKLTSLVSFSVFAENISQKQKFVVGMLHTCCWSPEGELFWWAVIKRAEAGLTVQLVHLKILIGKPFKELKNVLALFSLTKANLPYPNKLLRYVAYVQSFQKFLSRHFQFLSW